MMDNDTKKTAIDKVQSSLLKCLHCMRGESQIWFLQVNTQCEEKQFDIILQLLQKWAHYITGEEKLLY